ncbi:cell division topological specificity factor MinE [Helicobacter sp. 23-1044]
MSFLDRILGRGDSAKIAKNRLSIVLATERSTNLPYINEMRNEIIEVIKKYTGAGTQNIHFKTDSNQNINMLEIEIKLN